LFRRPEINPSCSAEEKEGSTPTASTTTTTITTSITTTVTTTTTTTTTAAAVTTTTTAAAAAATTTTYETILALAFLTYIFTNFNVMLMHLCPSVTSFYRNVEELSSKTRFCNENNLCRKNAEFLMLKKVVHIVTYRSIARQRLGEHIAAESYARNNRTPIGRQLICKQGISTIERPCFLRVPCRGFIKEQNCRLS
jgi:hypothetical protein